MDNQDKQAWCRKGESLERAFAARAPIQGWGIAMNPAKHTDPYSHDHIATVPMDLKTMDTQWRKSEELFGIPPEFAVSINQKDFVRYKKLYPNILIVLDVKWLDRCFILTLTRARKLIREQRAKTHEYKDRKDDTRGNAKVSYVFDIRDLDAIT